MKLRVKVENQSFEVEVGDLNARPILATIDGECFEVWPEDNGKPVADELPKVPGSAPVSASTSTAYAATLAQAAPVTANKTKAVLAPIPGVILSIAAKEGDTVSYGQELCVLEAMKMKNIIRATRAGTISVICVSPGDQVKHNQALMEFTD